MRARALVALGGKNLTREEIANGGLAHLERGTFEGEGTTWETAKADAGVPADGMILYWLSDE